MALVFLTFVHTLTPILFSKLTPTLEAPNPDNHRVCSLRLQLIKQISVNRNVFLIAVISKANTHTTGHCAVRDGGVLTDQPGADLRLTAPLQNVTNML